MDNAQSQSYKYGQRVITSLGKGEIVAQFIEHDAWLVCFSRKEFAPEVWRSMCPANGPCMFRMVKSEDVKPEVGR